MIKPNKPLDELLYDYNDILKKHEKSSLHELFDDLSVACRLVHRIWAEILHVVTVTDNKNAERAERLHIAIDTFQKKLDTLDSQADDMRGFITNYYGKSEEGKEA